MTKEKSSLTKTWKDFQGVPEAQQIYDAGVKDGIKIGSESKQPEGLGEGANEALSQYKTKWGFEFGSLLGKTIEDAFRIPQPSEEQVVEDKGPSFKERAGQAASFAGRAARVAWSAYRSSRGVPPTSRSTEIVPDEDIIEATFVKDN